MRAWLRINVAIFVLAGLWLMRAQLNGVRSQWPVYPHLGGSHNLTDVVGESEPGQNPSVGDKVVVMGKLQSEDTDWVAEHLPEFVQQSPQLADNRTNN